LTASREADLEIKKQKQLFDVELENALMQYYESVVDALRHACTPDKHQRSPFHYGALARFTWCYKGLEQLITVENLPGLPDFLQVAKDIQDLEWRQDRVLDPKKYLHIMKDVKATLPPVLSKKRLTEFRTGLKAAIKVILNTHDINGHTPLHLAAYVGQYNCVRLFIENGADKAHQGYAETALNMAGTKLVMRYLTSLEESAATGDSASYKHLINSGYSANESKNEFLMTSVHKAVLHMGESLATVLECEGDVNTIEWNIYTPLHYAAYYGNLRDAEVLLLNGALVNAISNYKYTPIHLAAIKDNHLIIKLLAENHGDLEAVDHLGCTPLMLAAKKGGLQSVRYILTKGTNVYHVDFRGWNALHYAVFNRKV
jgi:ankyrin repeat protein